MPFAVTSITERGAVYIETMAPAQHLCARHREEMAGRLDRWESLQIAVLTNGGAWERCARRVTQRTAAPSTRGTRSHGSRSESPTQPTQCECADSCEDERDGGERREADLHSSSRCDDLRRDAGPGEDLSARAAADSQQRHEREAAREPADVERASGHKSIVVPSHRAMVPAVTAAMAASFSRSFCLAAPVGKGAVPIAGRETKYAHQRGGATGC